MIINATETKNDDCITKDRDLLAILLPKKTDMPTGIIMLPKRITKKINHDPKYSSQSSFALLIITNSKGLKRTKKQIVPAIRPVFLFVVTTSSTNYSR